MSLFMRHLASCKANMIERIVKGKENRDLKRLEFAFGHGRFSHRTAPMLATIKLNYPPQTLSLSVSPQELCGELVSRVAREIGRDSLTLETLRGLSLNDCEISDLEVEKFFHNLPFVSLNERNISLDGGTKKKKKKRKAWNTPKHTKHVRKTKKMHIPSLYEVDKSGEVSCKREMCANCGEGYYLSQHFNRVYCGFCKFTKMLNTNQATKIKA
ncbi:MAG: ubiquitin-40S ribosomal protein S27a [Marteilia pararefringens]